MNTSRATLKLIKSALVMQLTDEASKALPSRGQVSVTGTLNGREINQVIEPDGIGGHWLKLSDELQKELSLTEGDEVVLGIAPTKTWPEPTIPNDFSQALASAPADVQELWDKITPMARWEWVRWINSTNVVETRERRLDVSISKMSSGKRRPCCFNLASCTDPELAKSGKLGL